MRQMVIYMWQLFTWILTVMVLLMVVLGQNDVHLLGLVVTAFLSVLPIALVWEFRGSRTKYYLFLMLHFLLTGALVMGSLAYFGISSFWRGLMYFVGIYVAAQIRAELRNRRAVRELNARISATHQGESATH